MHGENLKLITWFTSGYSGEMENFTLHGASLSSKIS